MRIGIVSAVGEPVPPFGGYGAVERDVYDLTLGLAERGHEVTLLASGDSTIEADGVTLVPVTDRSINGRRLQFEERWELIAEIQARIIGLTAELAYRSVIEAVNVRWEHPELVAGIGRLALPQVASLAFPRTPRISAIIDEAKAAPHTVITAHTESHRRLLADPAVEVVQLGVTMDHMLPSAEPLSRTPNEPSLPILRELKRKGQDYLFHVGVIAPRKSQATAIAIAKEAGIPLVLAGEPFFGDQAAQQYLQEQVMPHIDDERVYYYGNAPEADKLELMRYSKALLFCSGMETGLPESFGRILAESTACGAPAVGYRFASFPELIEEGTMGFGFDDSGEAVRQIGRLDSIDRLRCAELARQRLSSKRYIDAMENLLQRLIRGQGDGRKPNL